MDLLGAERSEKYDVPLGHLDFDYINKCTDAKHLEKIVKTLRLGIEGRYPELEKHAEKRLETLNPKSKVLMKSEPVKTSKDLGNDEFSAISGDLADWASDMKNMEETLKAMKMDMDDANVPPVRGSGASITTQKAAKSSGKEPTKKSGKNVTPRDYREWDKIDIDAELAKIDDEEKEPKSEKQVKNVMRKTKKPQIPHTVDTTGLTDQEKLQKAEREKDKGNEAFRAGDHEEALVYYDRSLSIIPTVASRNNRAQTYIKLKKWKSAIDDCSLVLQETPKNVKALLRRAVAFQGDRQLNNAKNDLEHVIAIEPNNQRAKMILKEVEQEVEKQKSKGRRMVVEETDGSSSSSEDEETEEVDMSKTTKKIIEIEEAVKEKEGLSTNSALMNGAAESHVKDDSEKSDAATKATSKDIWSEEILENEKNKSAGQTKDNPGNKKNKGKHKKEQASKAKSETENKTDSDKLEHSAQVGNSTTTAEKSNVSETEVPVEKVMTSNPAPPLQLPLPANVAALKEQGNKLFKNGQYADAIEKYTTAIAKLTDIASHTLNLSILHSNRAMCHMKIGDCTGCIKDCTISLEYCPGGLKSLMRRAQAYEACERYRHAYVDFRQAMNIEGSLDTLHQGMSRCMKMLQIQDGTRWRDKLPPVTPCMIPAESSSPSSASSTTLSSSSSLTSSFPGNQSSSVPPPSSSSSPSLSSSKQTPPPLNSEHQFETLKEKGKTHVQRAEYEEAAVCYTKCIEIFPHRPVPYANRALCYLKLNKPELVVTDCNSTLELDPENVKAIFRRAQAYKTLKMYSKSSADLDRVLQLEPKNAAARKEMPVVRKLAQEQAAAAKASEESSKTRQKLKIVEIEDSSDEEEEKPKKSKFEEAPKKNAKNVRPSQPISSQKKEVESSKDATTSPTHSEASTPPHTVRETSPPSATSPSVNISTPYEFIQAWSSLKTSDLEPYVKLLEQIEPTDLPKVVSNKLDGHMLSTIVRCGSVFIDRGEASRALAYLQNLTTVPRFQMVSMFMSNKEKQDMESVLKCLELQANCDILLKDLNRLRKAYSLC